MSSADQAVSHIRSLLWPLLSAQRASWEQGTAAQALAELWELNEKHKFAPDLELFQYLYGFSHDAILRASNDGRLATRLNSNDEGNNDGGALDPACIGETIYVVIERLNILDAEAEEIGGWREKVEGMVEYLRKRAQRMLLSDEDRENNPGLPEEGVLLICLLYSRLRC
jgi:unsaturated rhamnogalacturonyl hydrolase